MIFIIEGVDNVGKGTLIEGIQNRLGFHTVIKYDKPKVCEAYKGNIQEYQFRSFANGFGLLRAAAMANCQVIFDRFHLGEMVYSPIHRGYSGHYVLDMEKNSFKNDIFQSVDRNVELILLTASHPELLPDDGKSIDPKKINQEQALFNSAFSYSIFNKRAICVQTPGGKFRPKEEILEEVIGK